MDGSTNNSSDNSDKVPDLKVLRKREIMELLHEFNDVKDAAQIVLGALANMRGITLKEIHRVYNLPLSE